ncbi:hypothetical protein LIA77_05353 [Sarocladium implicatum]|nr:hypothetical protein LIA77_05353 [Sarocladium implicatum]
MSFLTERMLRPMAMAVPRASIALNAPRAAAFSISMAARKSPVETAKDAAKKVDRTVSDGLVTGIDAAVSAKDKAKETISSSDAAAKAEELKGEAKGKAQELKGEASGAAAEAKGKAKGAAAEAKSKL